MIKTLIRISFVISYPDWQLCFAGVSFKRNAQTKGIFLCIAQVRHYCISFKLKIALVDLRPDIKIVLPCNSFFFQVCMIFHGFHGLIDQLVKSDNSFLKRKVWNSILGQVKSNAMLLANGLPPLLHVYIANMQCCIYGS